MEVENKPNQTDTSEVETPTEEISLDDLIKERVAEAIALQKPTESSPETSKEATDKVGPGSDVSTQKDSSSATDPNKEVLSLVEGVLGRKFDTVDDVKKTLSNLKSLVGDQAIAKTREDAKLYDSFVNRWASTEGKTVEEAKKFWADTLTGNAPAVKVEAPVKKSNQPETPVVDIRVDKTASEVEELKSRLDRSDLLGKYPYAAEVQEEIAIIARNKGISQIEAFEKSPLKSLAENKAKEESKKSPVVTSSNRIGFDSKKVQDLGVKVLKNNKEEDKIALVKASGLI